MTHWAGRRDLHAHSPVGSAWARSDGQSAEQSWKRDKAPERWYVTQALCHMTMLLLLTPFAHALRHAWATPPAVHEGRRYAFMTCLNSVYGVLYNTHTPGRSPPSWQERPSALPSCAATCGGCVRNSKGGQGRSVIITQSTTLTWQTALCDKLHSRTHAMARCCCMAAVRLVHPPALTHAPHIGAVDAHPKSNGGHNNIQGTLRHTAE